MLLIQTCRHNIIPYPTFSLIYGSKSLWNHWRERYRHYIGHISISKSISSVPHFKFMLQYISKFMNLFDLLLAYIAFSYSALHSTYTQQYRIYDAWLILEDQRRVSNFFHLFHLFSLLLGISCLDPTALINDYHIDENIKLLFFC